MEGRQSSRDMGDSRSHGFHSQEAKGNECRRTAQSFISPGTTHGIGWCRLHPAWVFSPSQALLKHPHRPTHECVSRAIQSPVELALKTTIIVANAVSVGFRSA